MKSPTVSGVDRAVAWFIGAWGEMLSGSPPQTHNERRSKMFMLKLATRRLIELAEFRVTRAPRCSHAEVHKISQHADRLNLPIFGLLELQDVHMLKFTTRRSVELADLRVTRAPRCSHAEVHNTRWLNLPTSGYSTQDVHAEVPTRRSVELADLRVTRAPRCSHAEVHKKVD
ncbi:hypothetical protein J6590_007655 [Homalodisca vitripennis]|nr:hypothetical protein J6590_007655 [Homalodisca vitripennis]